MTDPVTAFGLLMLALLVGACFVAKVTGDHTGDWWEAEVVEDDDDTDE